MNFPKTFLKHTAAFVFLSTTALTAPAYAFDATSYVEKYSKLAESSGFAITQRAIEPVGSNGFALLDVKISSTKDASSKPLTFTRIEITGIKDDVGGGFAAENILVEGMLFEGKSKKGESVSIKMDRAAIVGAYYPDPTDIDAVVAYFQNTSLATSPLEIVLDGKKVASIGSVSASNEMVSSKLSGVTNMQVENIFFDLTAIDDPKFAKQREAIGYDQLNMGINVLADYNLESGDMNVSEYSFSGTEIGKLGMTFSIGGYTLDTAKLVKQWTIDNQGKSDKEMQAAMITLLPVLGNVTLKSASITFDDASITNRILGMQAARMGKKAEEISAMVPTMAMIGLSQLGNPAFAGAVAGALGQFMNEPGNLKIVAQPESPVTVPELVAISATDPRQLIEKLNVQVTANQ